MKTIALNLFVFFLMGCSNFQTRELEHKTQTIELEYIAWACDCANWATPKDIEKFYDKEDSLSQKVFLSNRLIKQYNYRIHSDTTVTG